MTQPVILAFDTSGHHCAAALLWGDNQVAHVHHDMAKGQAEQLMPILQSLLDEEGIKWSDLSAIAVGIGPGNFTGIRISVAAARGLALALGIPAIGVSNFEILRGPLSETDQQPQLVSLPAPRGTNYLQLFDGARPVGSTTQVTVSADGLADHTLAPGTEIIGNKARDLWSLLARDREGAAIERELSRIAETMVRIAADKLRAGVDPALRPAPLYVRSADAAPPRDVAPQIIA